MTDLQLAADLLATEEASTVQELTADLGDRQEETGLRLTGLEVVGFLAAKVVVPVVAGFISREAWERWNKIRTRREAAKARADLASQRVGELQVDREVLIEQAIQALEEEGVGAATARHVVVRAFERVSERARLAGS